MNAWDQPADQVKGYAARKGIRYPLLIGGNKVGALCGIEGIPANFFIDREGKIAESEIGFRGEEALEAPIKKILPGKSG